MKREKELLRKQLELLAEQSEEALEDDLSRLSSAMCEIYQTLKHPTRRFGLVVFFASLANLCVSILVHIQNILG